MKINISKVLNLLLAASLLILIVKISVNGAPVESTKIKDTTENQTLKTIHERKSVRHYTDKKVSREQLEILVKAGMAAPTAMNKQPWNFVVVNKR